MSTLDRDKNLKSEAAKEKPRDAHGHFIKDVKDAVEKVTEFSHKASDDEKLVKVEVNDPLAKIYRLLEQLKQQKAFAFNLKGSLGLAGIAVTLSIFGLFGGSKVLCDKGIQTQIGTVRILNSLEPEPSGVPLIGFVVDFLRGTLGTQTAHNRIVLELEDTSTIYLPRTKASPQTFKDQLIYATGQYDNCSKVLKVNSIEAYN